MMNGESVGLFLNQARNALTADMDGAIKALDLSTMQMGLLITMKRGAASTPFELSKLLSIDTGAMTRMLDKLEAKGLLTRSRSLEDRRVVNLALTEKGEQVMEQACVIVPQVLNARLAGFTVQEFNELRRLLAKFANAA
jgi:DNA-binding MarR family transcriptional regulator